MITEQELKKAVEAILLKMDGRLPESAVANSAARPSVNSEDCLPDLGAVDLTSVIKVPHPHNMEALKALRKSTPARIAVGRAGPRYLTETLLRFRADHAAAMDAVFTEADEAWLEQHSLPRVQTECESKDIFLTRPDLGQRFNGEETAKIKNLVGNNNRVVIYIADGLSTTAVLTNAMDTYKAICDGLQRHSIKPCAPFFVQYGRVGSEDAISEAVNAELVAVLIGERPGLLTAESMSAYIAYRATTNMPEARRTVVSNIHKGGTPAVEAGGYISDLIKKMLDQKASGLDLKV
jgi:ethanolamine ammonia-lyase small subunit